MSLPRKYLFVRWRNGQTECLEVNMDSPSDCAYWQPLILHDGNVNLACDHVFIDEAPHE